MRRRLSVVELGEVGELGLTGEVRLLDALVLELLHLVQGLLLLEMGERGRPRKGEGRRRRRRGRRRRGGDGRTRRREELLHRLSDDRTVGDAPAVRTDGRVGEVASAHTTGLERRWTRDGTRGDVGGLATAADETGVAGEGEGDVSWTRRSFGVEGEL